MKLAFFFVSISSFCVVCGLCGGDLTVSPPPPLQPPGSSPSPHSWQPPKGMYGSKDGRGKLTRRKEEEEKERRETLEVNDQCKKNQDLQSGTADGVFASVSSQRRELSHTRSIAADELFYITFLSSWLVFPLFFFFVLFLIRDAVLKKAKTSSYELLLCTALSQQLLSFSTRDKPCNQKLLWSHFDFSVSGFLLTCHI